jgi:tetratricopeptide (TPR) repeat protein
MAWKSYLYGSLAQRAHRHTEATALLLQSAALAFTAAMSDEPLADVEAMRLCSHALTLAGRIQRRQDRADLAYQTHLAAHHLRQQHGSWGELWETAVELGLDAGIARRPDDAERWFREAIGIAPNTSEGPGTSAAIAWAHLANSFIDTGRYDEAVKAARESHRLWHESEPGSAEAARSSLKLGLALLCRGEEIESDDARTARVVLESAIDHLQRARVELSAFGSICAGDARSAAEQLEVGQRLLDELPA